MKGRRTSGGKEKALVIHFLPGGHASKEKKREDRPMRWEGGG